MAPTTAPTMAPPKPTPGTLPGTGADQTGQTSWNLYGALVVVVIVAGLLLLANRMDRRNNRDELI